MADVIVDQLPGFRRRFRITPHVGRICCEVEDDYHCMRVTIEHDGTVATGVDAHMRRSPWTTCPGAQEELRATFTGLPLADFAARRAAKANCTHLYDLALLAASHVADTAPLVYDILVSDPLAGERHAELRRDGRPVLAWTEADFGIVAPEALAGKSLWDLRSWIDGLEPPMQEAAKLLRWGNILANGRQIPLEQQSDAGNMPPNCFTFQPERAAVARRVGEIRDFSDGPDAPLDGYEAFA